MNFLEKYLTPEELKLACVIGLFDKMEEPLNFTILCKAMEGAMEKGEVSRTLDRLNDKTCDLNKPYEKFEDGRWYQALHLGDATSYEIKPILKRELKDENSFLSTVKQNLETEAALKTLVDLPGRN